MPPDEPANSCSYPRWTLGALAVAVVFPALNPYWGLFGGLLLIGAVGIYCGQSSAQPVAATVALWLATIATTLMGLWCMTAGTMVGPHVILAGLAPLSVGGVCCTAIWRREQLAKPTTRGTFLFWLGFMDVILVLWLLLMVVLNMALATSPN